MNWGKGELKPESDPGINSKTNSLSESIWEFKVRQELLVDEHIKVDETLREIIGEYQGYIEQLERDEEAESMIKVLHLINTS